MKISSPGIVSHALPHLQHPVQRGLSQGSQVGKSFQKTWIVPQNPLHLGLLQHDLGDQDVVGVLSAPPGQIPPVLGIPRQKSPPKLVDHIGRWSECGILLLYHAA